MVPYRAEATRLVVYQHTFNARGSAYIGNFLDGKT